MRRLVAFFFSFAATDLKQAIVPLKYKFTNNIGIQMYKKLHIQVKKSNYCNFWFQTKQLDAFDIKRNLIWLDFLTYFRTSATCTYFMSYFFF